MDIAFFFMPRGSFTAHDGAVSGELSDLFIGVTDGGYTGIEGPFGNFNDGFSFPSVNGKVESASVFDFPLTLP